MSPYSPFSNYGETRVILISGFLGSGKTTLINHILKNSPDLSGVIVVVNEFGKLGIDRDLILHKKDGIVELTSGCICCTLVMDLKKCLLEAIPRYRPRIIILEASGVADPSGVIRLFRDPEINNLYRLDKIVTVLDADCWRMRRVFGALFFSQLQAADLMLVNKTDLIEQEILELTIRQLREKYPGSNILPTNYCAVDIEKIVGDDGGPPIREDPSGISLLDSGQNREKARACCGVKVSSMKRGTLSTFSFQEKGDLDKKAFSSVIENLPPNVFRIKGFVKFQDRTETLNHVGGKSHWTSCKGKSDTRLTIIGWDIDQVDLSSQMKRCLVKRNLS